MVGLFLILGVGDVTICARMSGKSTFFVANQSNLEDMPTEKVSSLEKEKKELEEENKGLSNDVKSMTSGK